MQKYLKMIFVGLAAGFISEALLGILFVNPLTQSILYNPELQGQLFLTVTAQRNVPISIAGLVVLSIIHAWLYVVLGKSIPGETWVKKGLFWGMTIWLMYWVFQEWFVYHTLLNEPLLLNALELVLLLIGSSVEGLVIAFGFRKEVTAKDLRKS
jgi:hypothetical protein